MCGIWGFVGVEDPINIQDAWDGLCSISHRGPDSWGFYTNQDGIVTTETAIPEGTRSTFLGNRRLSILDLSASGNQPMKQDGSILVYNGEVYNYKSLRERLRGLGYTFNSDSDTEVVLAAYREYGTNCVEHLSGMFAFAVYDESAEKLFLARDRLGIKPLYFTQDCGGIAFASEVTALLDGNIIPRELNKKAIADFLRVGYVPGPETIVKGVCELPAGTTCIYDTTTGEVTTTRYWSPTFDDSSTRSPERLRELLQQSISDRLMSDVPLGAFLSGGLDSSAIVALMTECSDTPKSVHTCSIGFEESSYNESEYATAVANEIGTTHCPREVSGEDVQTALPEIIERMDQPSVDAINTYFVSETAVNDELTVALSGLGSDELLFGYPTFSYVRRLYSFARMIQRLPQNFRDSIGEFFYYMDSKVSRLPLAEVGDVVRSSASFGASYLAVRGLFTKNDVSHILTHSPSDEVPLTERVEADIAGTLDTAGVEAATSQAELSWYMQYQLLRDTDAMSMSHSLEVRVPFLDKNVVEYITRLPATAKRSDGTKKLLQQAVSDILPDSVLQRDKSGFVFPFAEWLRDDLEPLIEEALSPEKIKNTPLDPNAVQQVRADFETGQRHWERLWSLVVLSLWIDTHITSEKQ